MNGDAGFRRYFRFSANNTNYIAVDSPIKYCNNTAFIAVGNALKASQITVPEIVFVDPEQGFFCLQDFGDNLLADSLSSSSMEKLYQRAIDLLPVIANATLSDDVNYQLPTYDREFISTELNIFIKWLIEEYLNLSLSKDDIEALNQCFEVLIENALEQPQVTMHRDYHSRNLMLLPTEEIGVIDFQDAVVGPVTYDIVSLLRDCYVRWPDEQVVLLFNYFIESITPHIKGCNVSGTTWQRWFDLMGIQRHIKASGIFARLLLRDNKSQYIDDIPLTLSYIQDISLCYSELNFLSKFINEKVIPAVDEKMK